MNRGAYAMQLVSEFFAFARARKAYWIIPLLVVLGVSALFVVGGQTAAPLIYTLF